MQFASFDKLGGLSLIVGSVLFAAYAALFPFLLPIGNGTFDFVAVVLNPNWEALALIAFFGILLMLVGFHAVQVHVRSRTGALGAAGFLFIQVAFLLQACKVTWELFLYPIIASHAGSAFLFRDEIIRNDPHVAVFRGVSALTIFVGVTLFSLMLHRSRAYPKAAPLLIFFGAVVYGVGPAISIFVSIAGIFVFAIGCSMLGVRLLKPIHA